MNFHDLAAVLVVLYERIDPLLVTAMQGEELLDVTIANEFLLVDAENLERLFLRNEPSTDSEAFDRNLHLLT